MFLYYLFLLLSFWRSTFDKKNSGSNWRFLSAGKISIRATHYVLDIFQVIAIDNQKSLPFLTEILICISVPDLTPATDFVLKIKTDGTEDCTIIIIRGAELITSRLAQKANIKWKKIAISFDLFLLTLQSLDSLNDIHKDIFQPNKEIVIYGNVIYGKHLSRRWFKQKDMYHTSKIVTLERKV